MIRTRSILSYILLSAITFGIYSFYWIYMFQKDLNRMSEDGQDVEPILVMILFICTFGIYPLIWYYTQGERMKRVGQVKGIPVQESGATYLLWAIVGVLLCGLGPLIAMAKFIKNFNQIATVYNHKIIENAK